MADFHLDSARVPHLYLCRIGLGVGPDTIVSAAESICQNYPVKPGGVMKVGEWDMLPLPPRKRKSSKNRIKVDTMVAIQKGKRVLVHRVEKRLEDVPAPLGGVTRRPRASPSGRLPRL